MVLYLYMKLNKISYNYIFIKSVVNCKYPEIEFKYTMKKNIIR
jgi:hypothetical protein